jgi:hypothetical protein|tara:strand:+ start:559 stop:999 length:441 start_codon:yes stop_codon:yes gene_type:complete
MKTIVEAKQHLRDNFKKGTECPCCGKYVKAYKRKLNSGIARALILMYRLGAYNGKYIHVQNEFAKLKLRATTMDYAYAEKWKLINDGDDIGTWTLTQRGVQFVLGQTFLPDHCLVYNGNVYSWSDDLVNITTALTNSFNYDELMTL